MLLCALISKPCKIRFCGCSTVFLFALENGKQTAELERALRVANTLGLDLSLSPREAR